MIKDRPKTNIEESLTIQTPGGGHKIPVRLSVLAIPSQSPDFSEISAHHAQRQCHAAYWMYALTELSVLNPSVRCRNRFGTEP